MKNVKLKKTGVMLLTAIIIFSGMPVNVAIVQAQEITEDGNRIEPVRVSSEIDEESVEPVGAADLEAIDSGSCGENVYWSLLKDGTLNITGSGKMEGYNEDGDIYAPWSDYSKNITKVIIAENVTSIGREAFMRCRNLTEVTISSSVTSIGVWAFLGCNSLAEVTIPSSVTRIGCGVFRSCSSLTKVTIPSGVTEIEDEAFWGCSSLTEVTIPSGVTRIGEEAFWGCSSLTKVTIPSNVTNIGDNVFLSCSSLRSIEVGENSVYYSSEEGVLYNKNKTKLLRCPEGKEGEYIIPCSVTSIQERAFQNCRNLTGVTIPSSVTTIGERAFEDCVSLTEVTISSGVTIIGEKVFWGCSSLRSIEVDENNVWYSSEEGALFYKNKDVLLHCPSGKEGEYTIPSSVVKIQELAFYCCSGLTSVVIPNGVKSIEEETFWGCSSLERVTIPESVTSIHGTVFYGCDNLTIYCIENSYAHTYAIEHNIPYKFGKPDNLEIEDPTKPDTEVNKPIDLETDKPTRSDTDRSTTSGTVQPTVPNTSSTPTQTKVSLGKAVITLLANSYNYDGKAKKPTVKSVKLGNKTLKSGTDYTVSYANNKNIGTATVTITGKGNYTSTAKKTFKITAKKGSKYTVSANKYKITGSSTVSFTGLKSAKTTKVTIPKTVKIGGKNYKVTAVDVKALQNKKKVTSVTIGANVTSVGKNAFTNCKKLRTITIKSTKLKTVGKNAFKGIKSTAKIKVPAKKLTAYKKLLKGKGQGKKVKITK